ncbi:MAG: N-acetyltransferase [Mangrovicoccus sp.]|nr:N-acetyltransferase [Mangrovicoccus sp.]
MIEPMGLAELEMVLGWAAQEGWNPGIEDAAAFLAADTEGFLLKRVGEQPVAAISVVNHSPELAFLGLYLVRPEYRAQGHGIDIWRAGLAHAGGRCVGLDGVPAQQENYERSGFQRAGATTRYGGRVKAASASVARPLQAADMPPIEQLDREIEGYERRDFLRAWLAQTDTRRSVVVEGGEGLAMATGRRCGEGIKIGPLTAPDGAAAWALITALANELSHGGEKELPVFVDVPDHAQPLAELLTSQGFEPVFETARMYLGAPPQGLALPYRGVASLELG